MDLFSLLKKRLKVSPLIAPMNRLVLGVSGGVDSMVLLDLFNRLRGPFELKLVVAHLDHGIRGKESAKDARFVEKEAKKRGISFEQKKAPKNFFKGKGNFQEVARRFRLRFFERVAKKHKASFIVTAHQADDWLETFLMRLIRGAGVDGLKGMAEERPFSEENKGIRLVRPLLFFSRDQILEYARASKVAWREDSSNRKEQYLRNRVRLRIVKEMKRLNPRIVENMAATLDSLQKEETWIEKGMERALRPNLRRKENETHIGRRWLESLDPALRYRVYRHLFKTGKLGLEGIGRLHLEALEEMVLTQNKKARLTLPRGFGVYLTDKQLVLKKWSPVKRPRKSGFFY
jgi:tRNA(Ile)-lysidine synthase